MKEQEGYGQGLTKEQEEVLASISFTKIFVPVLLGLAVVGVLMWKTLDVEEFRTISWGGHILFWMMMAIFCYVIRHLMYAYRLMVLSNNDFGLWKSIELIFIWEFASAVSPTSLGGSAVALFLLAQEKISTARTVSIVIYSVVLDTLFFIISMPLLYILLGPLVIRPGMTSFGNLDGFGLTFILVLIFMIIYGVAFFYGLFINPTQIKRFLIFLSNRKILTRFKKNLRSTAEDIVISSKEMAKQSWLFHIKSIILTSGAWIFRFLAINCIIIALVSNTSLDFWNQLLIYGRGEVMYAVTAFSPTPGGSGIAEIVFGGFYSDFISKGLSTLAAIFWRLITYYPYLIIGVILIPNWIRKVINRRRHK